MYKKVVVNLLIYRVIINTKFAVRDIRNQRICLANLIKILTKINMKYCELNNDRIVMNSMMALFSEKFPHISELLPDLSDPVNVKNNAIRSTCQKTIYKFRR